MAANTYPQGFGTTGGVGTPAQAGAKAPSPFVQATGAPTAPPPAPAGYGQAFQSALGAARGSIQAQLGAALGDIAQQQQAAGQALQQLPGGINQAYGQANGTLNGALQQISAAQGRSGMTPLMPLSATIAPEQAAIAGSHAAALANVPLLNIGIQQQANNERSQAQMSAMDQQQQLAMQQAQEQAAAEQARQQQQAAMAEQQQQQGFQSSQNALDRNLQMTLAGAKTNNAQLTDKNGLPLGFTAGDYSHALASPQYKVVQTFLTQNANNPNALAQYWQAINSGPNAISPALRAAIMQQQPGLATLPAWQQPQPSQSNRGQLPGPIGALGRVEVNDIGKPIDRAASAFYNWLKH